MGLKHLDAPNKLNIGSGNKNRSGYVNVDIRRGGSPDILADVGKMQFKDAVFEEILAIDVLEHLSFVECKSLLRRCWSWLMPNGTIQIHVPNIRYLASVLAERNNHAALEWVYGSDGEGETNHEHGYHKWGYSEKSISDVLASIGFQIIDTSEDCFGYGLQVTALKRG